MYEANWRPMQPASKRQNALNCPPFAGAIASYSCTRSGYCPFCWGRGVVEIFRCFERIFFGRGSIYDKGIQTTEMPRRCKLIRFNTLWRFPKLRQTKDWSSALAFVPNQTNGLKATKRFPNNIFWRIASYPSAEVDALNAVFGYVMHRVDFSPDDPNVLTLERSGLALVPYWASVMDYYDSDLAQQLRTRRPVKSFIQDLGEPNRIALLKGVSEAFHYPRGLLYHTKVNEVVSLLERVDHHMITATFGASDRDQLLKAIAEPSDITHDNVL